MNTRAAVRQRTELKAERKVDACQVIVPHWRWEMAIFKNIAVTLCNIFKRVTDKVLCGRVNSATPTSNEMVGANSENTNINSK